MAIGGDVAEKQSVDVSGGPPSSGATPHIQSLTLIIQHIPLKSNQEKYSLFVRFARPGVEVYHSPAEIKGHRELQLRVSLLSYIYKPNEGFQNLWASPELRSDFTLALKPVLMIHFGLCMHTQTQKPEQIQILQQLEENEWEWVSDFTVTECRNTQVKFSWSSREKCPHNCFPTILCSKLIQNWKCLRSAGSNCFLSKVELWVWSQ